MDDDQLWRLRGIYTQVCAAEQDIVFALADRRLTDSRKRDLVRRLEHLIDQIKGEEA